MKLPSFWECTGRVGQDDHCRMLPSPEIYKISRGKGKMGASDLARGHGLKTARGWRQRDQYQTGQMSLSTYHSPFLPASHFSSFLETCILFGITSFPSCFDKQNTATLTEGPVWWGGQVPETSRTGNAASGLVQASEYSPIFWYTAANSGYFAQWAMNSQGHWHCSASYSSETKFYLMLGFGTEKLYWGETSDASSVKTGTFWWEGGWFSKEDICQRHIFSPLALPHTPSVTTGKLFSPRIIQD